MPITELKKTASTEKRLVYFDFLRICGALSVIIIHVSGTKWFATDLGSTEWRIINFYENCIVRCAVPIFIMISGALFLDGTRSIEKIYKKNILRIVTAFIFWSVVYAVVDQIDHGGGGGQSGSYRIQHKDTITCGFYR